jgi:hypothetical protein
MSKAAQGFWASTYIGYVEGQKLRRTQLVGKITVQELEKIGLTDHLPICINYRLQH